MRTIFSAAGIAAASISLVVTSAVSAQAVERDGGYRECPEGKRISVQAQYTLNPGKSIKVRIYASPSRKTKKDVTVILSQPGRFTTSVLGRMRIGYWLVQSVQGDSSSIDGYNTKARCV